MEKGALIRYTRGPLGTLGAPDAERFEIYCAPLGSEGVYLGPHPTVEDWILTSAVNDMGRVCWVPVHPSMIEEVR